MIETKHIAPDRVALGRRPRPRSEAYESRRAVKHYTHSGGVTTCTRCPPRVATTSELRFCEDCARINKARFQAGLIKPPSAEQQADHPNNIINPHVAGSYRGQSRDARRYAPSGGPCITACIERLGNGWRRGIVTINGAKLYIGPKTRSQDDAWDYATARAKIARDAVAFESRVADIRDARL